MKTLQRAPVPTAGERSAERASREVRASRPESARDGAGNQALIRLLADRAIKPKLNVSQPSDSEELEADRMADAFVSRSVIHRKCASCEEEEEEEKNAKVHRSALGPADPAVAVGGLSRSVGSPLPLSSRGEYERFFKADLSHVRVHTGGDAQQAARALNAAAFTIRDDIFFGAGRFDTGTTDGRRLIAHEISHAAHPSPGGPAAVERISRQEANAAPAADAAPPAPPPGVLADTGPIKRPPPAAGNETITFEGVLLSTDLDFDRWQLEQQIASGGMSNVGGFVDRLVKAPTEDEKQLEANKKLESDTKTYKGDVSGAPLPPSMVKEAENRIQNKELTKKVAQTVKSVSDKLVVETNDFISNFESTGQGKLRQMLSESLLRVENEANHYGIPKEVLRSTGTTRTTAFPAPRTPANVVRPGGGQQWDQEYADRTEKAAIAPRKKLVDAAIALQKKRTEVAKLKETKSIPPPGQIAPDPKSPVDMLPLVKAQGEYAALRREKEAEFPILATYAQEGGDLNVIISAGGGEPLKKVLSSELIDKYNKIIATEGYIDEKKVTMWDVPTIVEGTRVVMKVDKDTMRWRVLQDKIAAVNKEKMEAKETKEAIGTIAMILGLIAAVPTLGASVGVAVGGAATAIGVGVAVADLQDYMMQSALSGTDFDRARAISQEEPSLFWMAFEIVGTILDVRGAVKAFRSLAGMRRAALLGEKEAAAALRQQGNHVVASLGDRIMDEVEKVQKAGGLGTKGSKVPQVVTRESLQAGKVAEAAVQGLEKHEIIITKAGAFRCSPKCADIMWLYEDVLQQYPSLKPRLQELIGLGESGSKTLAAFTQRMDRLREVALMGEKELKAALQANPAGTVLGDHLRFEQYRRTGGLASYEEWFAQSKGQAVKGPEVWGQLSEELKLPEGPAGSGKGLTPAQRQQILADARAVDTADSVAGNYRTKYASVHPDFPGGREWQVHHSIPQKFRATLTKAGINVDGPSFLRGVRTTPGEMSNVHAKITNNWENWHRDFKGSFSREPTAAEIIEHSKLVDWQYGGLFWEAEKAAGIPVPTKAGP